MFDFVVIPGGIFPAGSFYILFLNKKWFNDRSRIANIHFLIRLEEQLKNSLFVRLILSFLLLSFSLWTKAFVTVNWIIIENKYNPLERLIFSSV